jgi:hypothetical protein
MVIEEQKKIMSNMLSYFKDKMIQSVGETEKRYDKGYDYADVATDIKTVDEVIDERTKYIESIENEEEKRVALEYFLKEDKRLFMDMKKKRENIKGILLNQHMQKKIIDKYEEF